MVGSGLFNDARDAAQAAVKIMAGEEMGFGRVASMIGITFIRGRLTFSANLMAAAVRRSPVYDYQIKRHTNEVCEIEFIRNGRPVGTSTFTLEDARRAGLSQGENWRKYPRNMLFARAMSNGARWYCPDLFAGPVYLPDELGAAVDGETGEPVSPPCNDENVAPEPVSYEYVSLDALEQLVLRKGVDVVRLRSHYGVRDLDELTEAQRRDAVSRLVGRPDVNVDTAGTSPADDGPLHEQD
jgi:hypothetical protein